MKYRLASARLCFTSKHTGKSQLWIWKMSSYNFRPLFFSLCFSLALESQVQGKYRSLCCNDDDRCKLLLKLIIYILAILAVVWEFQDEKLSKLFNLYQISWFTLIHAVLFTAPVLKWTNVIHNRRNCLSVFVQLGRCEFYRCNIIC